MWPRKNATRQGARSVANYVPRVSQSRCVCMTSRSLNLAKAAPYGVYDIAANQGRVRVGWY
jgi:hypothetical protein